MKRVRNKWRVQNWTWFGRIKIKEKIIMATGMQKQISMKIADKSDMEDLVALRVEMQIEDWERTLNQDFSGYAQKLEN